MEAAVPFIIYVYSAGSMVPHMEVLAQLDRESARERAFQIMREDGRPERGELWQDDKLIELLKPQAPDLLH